MALSFLRKIRKKSGKWPLFIASLVALALSASFFYFKKPETKVPTVAVVSGSITEQAEAVGNIKMRNFSTVKSQVDGIVEAIYHEEGEYITKGTPLVKIKPAPKPVEYAEAYKNLLNDLTLEKHAATDFNRQEHLLKTGVIKANDRDYVTARKDRDAARNQRTLSEQKLALLTKGETVVGGKQVANVVNSEIDGYILYRNINIGDPVISISSAQLATALFIVADMRELIFQGLIDERDAARVKLGMDAKIKIGSLPDQEISGVITRIALQSEKENLASGVKPPVSSSDGSSNSPFNVGFKIDISKLQLPQGLILRSGYSATADIKIKKLDNILTLPMRVIQFKDDHKPYVLLPQPRGQKPKEQPVSLGISDNINVEIKSGLKLGEQVIDQADSTAVTQDK